MKRTHSKLFLVLLLIAVPGLLPALDKPSGKQNPDKTAAEDKRLDIGYDKARGRTNIQLKDAYSLEIKPGRVASLKLNVYYHCPGQDSACRPYTVLLSFEANASGWVFEKSDRQLILLVDNQRLPLGQLDWDGSNPEGSANATMEQMTVYAPTSTFERLLQAKVVEGHIGSTSFKIDPKDVAEMRELFKFPAEPSGNGKQQGSKKPQ